jgi:N-acetyl-alpha-D-muramate 1-phosphate uridylyltransferase
MDAMILAAGLGTRLRPLTDRIPKALVPVAGVPMLERVAMRLIEAGADRLIINLHHFGQAIRDFVAERDGFGVDVLFAHEDGAPLETGGGLLNAANLFRGDAPFFLHNGDILSDLPLRGMYEAHLRGGALATLAVMERESSRQLLFDDGGLLGRTDQARALRLEARAPVGTVLPLGFGGVHVISPTIFARTTETGAFSILDTYLRLVGEGERILPFRIDGALWIDIGKPEQLAAAEARMEHSLP